MKNPRRTNMTIKNINFKRGHVKYKKIYYLKRQKTVNIEVTYYFAAARIVNSNFLTFFFDNIITKND